MTSGPKGRMCPMLVASEEGLFEEAEAGEGRRGGITWRGAEM